MCIRDSRYSDKNGKIINEFPTNPNGSDHNIAAVCNPSGNVMAMMPHPERTQNGDSIFSSLKEFIELGNPPTEHTLSFEQQKHVIPNYQVKKGSVEWVIDMAITDNEASTVKNALLQLGHDVSITRQTHWEITTSGDQDSILKKIDETGELYNSNKEFIAKINRDNETASFLVRQKDNILGRSKQESLNDRFHIEGIRDLKRGVIWNVTVNRGSFDTVLNKVLNTNILYNPLSYECYRIN